MRSSARSFVARYPWAPSSAYILLWCFAALALDIGNGSEIKAVIPFIVGVGGVAVLGPWGRRVAAELNGKSGDGDSVSKG
jgi:hypothetical protein